MGLIQVIWKGRFFAVSCFFFFFPELKRVRGYFFKVTVLQKPRGSGKIQHCHL